MRNIYAGICYSILLPRARVQHFKLPSKGYIITVTNLGPEAASGVYFGDSIPDPANNTASFNLHIVGNTH